MTHASEIEVRKSIPEDIPAIISLCRAVYPESPSWTARQLESHVGVFPEGQLVAANLQSGQIMGFAASLVVLWDDYEMQSNWRDFTAGGTFSNHDPERGRTLYGAELMVHPEWQGLGVGKRLYKARRELAVKLGVLRIRAGARLRGYHRYASEMSAEEYVSRVVAREIGDPTLSFQLSQGFEVLAVATGYLQHDPESLGYAAVIEWLNPKAEGGQQPQQRLFSHSRRPSKD